MLAPCQGQIAPTDAAMFPEALPLMPMMCRTEKVDGVVDYAFAGLTAENTLTHRAHFQSESGERFAANLMTFRATLRSMRRYEPDPTDVRGTGWSAILSRELKKHR